MLNSLYSALGWLLSMFYELTKSYGFAIVLLTVAVRLVLFPLTAKQMRSMQGMSKLQPELKKLQAEHKDDRMKLQEEMTALYKREGVSPVGGCLPLIMQIPVFIGLFNVIRGLTNSGRLAWMQIEVPKPKYLNTSGDMYRSIVRSGGRLVSFGFDLAQSASGATGGLSKRAPFVMLVVAYVVTAFLQQHLAAKRNTTPLTGPNAQVQQIMKIFPLFLGFFYYTMPAGLVLYFVASNVWTIGQQEVLARVMPSTPPPVVDAPSTEKVVNESKDSTPARSKSSGTKPVATPNSTTKPQPGSTPRVQQQKQQKAANNSADNKPGIGTNTARGTNAAKKRKGR